jgi:hypothetical protein
MDTPEKKGKTKWNSDLFSDNIEANTKEGFHGINTKQKIKRIKKDKKVEIDNFKNIETFETLDNVTSSTTEGFNDDSTCRDNPDYEGCDNGDGNVKAKDPRQMLIDFINSVYAWFEVWFFIIAFFIAVALGQSYTTLQTEVNSIAHKRLKNGNKNNKEKQTVKSYNKLLNIDVSKFAFLPAIKDVQLIKKYVEWFFAILISCYAVFHVFFLFYYKNELYYKDGVELKDISTAKLREDATKSTYSIESLFLFFFQFAWWYVESFEYYFKKYFVSYTTQYLNATLCFILLFVCLIMYFYYYPSILKNFLFDLLNMNLKNKYVNIMYILVILLAIMDWFNIFNYLPGGPIYYKFFILIIVRFIIVLFVSLPFAGIFLFLYVLLYSFLGIFLYGKSEMGYLKIFETLAKYAEDTKNQIRIGTECSPNTLFEKIMITINVFMDFIYTYVFYLAFIVIFMFSFYDYSVNISSVPLKNGLLIITAVIIMMLSSLCINSFRLRAQSKFAAKAT